MKLNIKTIKGETFVIEAEKKDTVGGVKQKIFEAKAVEVATQKLIFKGMQLVDEKTLEECGVSDGDMMVMMSVKKVANAQPVQAQAQPQPQQQPVVNNSAAQQPAQQQQPVQGAGNQGGLGVNVLSEEQFNKTVDEIVTMGFSRQEAIVALQAAYNNPDRAIDYLLNGMPQNTNQAMFGAEEFDEDSDSGSPELNFGGAGAGGAGGIGGMPNSQMLSQLRAAIQQDPSVLQQILSQLATTNPQLYQLIQQHPSEFMNLLNSAEDSGNAGGEEGDVDDIADDDYEEVEVPAITANDNAAIERLCGLGFERAQALEAFVACEKDENMAANYLLEWSLRGENPPGQNNQNAPGNNSNPGQN